MPIVLPHPPSFVAQLQEIFRAVAENEPKASKGSAHEGFVEKERANGGGKATKALNALGGRLAGFLCVVGRIVSREARPVGAGIVECVTAATRASRRQCAVEALAAAARAAASSDRNRFHSIIVGIVGILVVVAAMARGPRFVGIFAVVVVLMARVENALIVGIRIIAIETATAASATDRTVQGDGEGVLATAAVAAPSGLLLLGCACGGHTPLAPGATVGGARPV